MTCGSVFAMLHPAMSFTTRRLREEKPSRIAWKPTALLLLRLGGPLVLLATRIIQDRREERAEQRERLHLLKRILVILIAVFCAVLLFAATAKALVSLQLLNVGSLMHVAATPLPADAHGHTNILLLGQGDADHDGIDLTDTIMIASIDADKTQSVALLSLPRDLWFLQTEKMGKGRINSLYRDYKVLLKRQGKNEKTASQEAMRELAAEIGRALGMDMHHTVKIDFVGFVQAVDALGGIEIDVPKAIVDTEYPGPNYSYQTFRIAAGLQTIDGETALKYARSRHSTSDFDRSARQQQIIAALGDKMRDGGILTQPGKIMDLLNILRDHVETTLPVREMLALAEAGKDIDRSKILSMQLTIGNGLYGAFSEPGGLLYTPPRDQFGGASVLLPVSIPQYPVTWRQIRTLVTLLMHERIAHLERAPILIRNAGAPEGSARQLGGELIRYGFLVEDIANAEEGDLPDSVLIGKPESPTALRLSELLNITFTPDPSLMPNSALSSEQTSETDNELTSKRVNEITNPPVTIYLGKSFVFTPLQSSFSTP
jgi:LCP family protein required for cell wall assembly